MSQRDSLAELHSASAQKCEEIDAWLRGQPLRVRLVGLWRYLRRRCLMCAEPVLRERFLLPRDGLMVEIPRIWCRAHDQRWVA